MARHVVEVDAVFGRIRCFEGDLLTKQIRQFGAHTRPELAFFTSVLEPGDFVFDLGAHLGSFTIPIARRVQPGRVVAVEGHRPFFDLLSQNVSCNELSESVTPVLAVVAPCGGEYVPVDNKRKSSGATHFVPRQPSQRHSSIPMRDIDGLVSEFGRPSALKVDVEGLELDILECSNYVADTRPILYAEVSRRQLGRYSRTVAEFNAFLHKLDYRLFRNVGDRNADHDRFKAAEVDDLTEIGQPLFDILALPHSSRISRIATS